MSLQARITSLAQAVAADVKSLASALASKASDIHTHTLADIAQGGAVTGDSIVWDGTSWVAGQPLPESWTDAYAFLMDAGNTGSDLETYLGVSENYFGLTALLARYEWLTVCDTGSATAMFAASSTAMTAVIASSTAFAAVIASSTAMTAVIASSTAFAAVIASSTAMAAVAASSTALTAIFADTSAKAAFKSSTALTVAAIPTMTSNTAPLGASAASTTYSAPYAAWKALDKSLSTSWGTANGSDANQWLSYDFTAPRFVHTARISTQIAIFGSSARIKDFRIEYSDDNTSWTTVVTGIKADAPTAEDFDVIHAGAHRYWRLFAINNRGDTVIEVTEFNLTGFILP